MAVILLALALLVAGCAKPPTYGCVPAETTKGVMLLVCAPLDTDQ